MIRDIIKYIYPLYVIKRIFRCIKEVFLFLSYVKSINKMEHAGILKENGFKRDGPYRLIKGINLKAETLLYGGEGKELKRFELGFIGKEISKYNDIFLDENILELIKTKTDRIKTDDHYGYVVNLMFNFNNLSTSFIVWIFLYIASVTYLISLVNIYWIISILS